MLRQEKLVQQAIHFEQSFAVQFQRVAFDGQEAPVLEPLQRRGETLQHVHTKFFLKVAHAVPAQLEVQDEFADEPLISGRHVGAIDGQFALVHRSEIRLELVLVLVMHAVQPSEARHAHRKNVRAGEQPFAIDELHLRRVAHHRRRARHGVADFLELAVSVLDPAALHVPVRDRRDQFALGLHALIDARVVRHLHLINRHRVGLERHGLRHRLAPLLLRLLDHAGDEINVDLREADLARVIVGANDFLRAMRAPVDFQNVIVEVLDAKAQARHAHVANGLELVVRERAWLGLEGDFLRRVPRQQRFHTVAEKLQLALGQIARRAAAEVEEARLAPADDGLARVSREFFQHRINVATDRRRIFVRIDLEVAEVAALPAERNVRVESEVVARFRCALQRLLELRNGVGLPEREGRIVRDEVAARRRLLLHRRRGGRRRGGDGDGAHDYFFTPKQ